MPMVFAVVVLAFPDVALDTVDVVFGFDAFAVDPLFAGVGFAFADELLEDAGFDLDASVFFGLAVCATAA